MKQAAGCASGRGWRRGLVAGALLVVADLGGGLACHRGPSLPEGDPITAPWHEDFSSGALGPEWYATTAGAYQITDGAIEGKGAYNHPLWLRKKLPADVVIELDCWSMSPAGDLKVELYGDGESMAHDKGQYTATGYVAVMGGWHNSTSVLVSGNEHRTDRAERRQPKVELGRHYHWKLVKRGSHLDWFVDDLTTPFLTWDQPLEAGGAYFAITDWEADVFFDNLSITPL